MRVRVELAALILLVVGYVGVFELAEPSFFVFDDNGNYFLPNYIHNWRSVVEHREIPVVNFHQLLGNRHLGQGQTGVLYLPVYGAFLVAGSVLGDLQYVIVVLVAGHLAMAVVGMYWLLGKLKVKPPFGWLGGLWLVSFPMVIGVVRSWVFVSYLLAYLPWALGCLLGLVNKKKKKYFWGLVGLKAMLLLTGYVQWFVVSSLFEMVVVGVVARGRLRRGLVDLLKVVGVYFRATVLAVLLAAPVMIPFYFTALSSVGRAGKLPYSWFVDHAVGVGELVRAQVFEFLGNEYFFGGSYILYIGLIPLLLVGLYWLGFYGRSDWKVRLFWGLSLLALVMSSEAYGGFYVVPGLNWFRWPFKHYLFFLVFVVVLVGLVASRLAKKGMSRYLLAGLVLVSIGSNVLVMWNHRGPENAFTKRQVVVPAVFEFEKEIGAKKGRVFSVGGIEDESLDHTRYLAFNSASLFGVDYLGGYDALKSTTQAGLVANIGDRATHDSGLSQELLDGWSYWGVRYLLVSEARREDIEEFGRLSLVRRGEGVNLYENKEALPMVYVGEGGIEPLEYRQKVNELVVEKRSERAQVVRFNVAALPQWQVFIDGERSLGLGSSRGQLEVVVPEGAHEIRLRFVDGGYRLGVWIMVGSVILIVLKQKMLTDGLG